MLRKLRNKLLLVNMISTSTVIIISFALIFLLASIHMDSLDSEKLRMVPTDRLVQSIVEEKENVDIPGDSTARGPFINPSRELPIDYNNAFVVNVDKSSGMVFVFSRMDLDKNDYSNAVEKATQNGQTLGTIQLRGQQWKFLFTGDNNEYIVFLDVSQTAQARARLMLNMIIMGLFVLAVVFFLSFVFANRAIRPVDDSMNRQKRFIADASHELKTPLAIIDASSEAMLADSDASVASQSKWLGRIGEESNRMRKLIESLLYLAKAEDALYAVMPVNLSQIVNDEIGRVEAFLFEHNVELTLFNYNNEPLIVNADNEKIGESILILLDNAVKYTDDGGKVIVEMGVHRHFGYLKISNTGVGIPPEELPKVFDRFYRVDKARNSSSGSFGLGLSIAKAIVERSEGKIYVTSENGITSFTIELPLA